MLNLYCHAVYGNVGNHQIQWKNYYKKINMLFQIRMKKQIKSTKKNNIFQYKFYLNKNINGMYTKHL